EGMCRTRTRASQAARARNAVRTGKTTGRQPRDTPALSARVSPSSRPAPRSAVEKLSSATSGYLFVPGDRATTTAVAFLDLCPEDGTDGVELRRLLDGQASRTGKRDAHVRDDGARPARHHQNSIREEHRFSDRVGHEEHGLLIALPDVEQRRVHLVAGDGVERA